MKKFLAGILVLGFAFALLTKLAISTLVFTISREPREEAFQSSDADYTIHQEIQTDKPFTAPPTDLLDVFFNPFGSRIGVYYLNVETGFAYAYNPDRVFFGASLNKANYALYIYTAAERGYIDLYAEHIFNAGDWWGGTGILRFKPAGTRLTTRELLYYSVVHSDNAAHRMLARYMDTIPFSYRDFTLELGGNPDFIIDAYSHNTSAADTALWFDTIRQYMESDSRYSHYLREDLLNTSPLSHPYFTRGTVFGGDGDIDVRLIYSEYPVAHKYGWSADAFNAAGIIYAESPFLLVIVSDMAFGAHELFNNIVEMMQAFNGRYFYAYD